MDFSRYFIIFNLILKLPIFISSSFLSFLLLSFSIMKNNIFCYYFCPPKAITGFVFYGLKNIIGLNLE